MKLKRGVLLFVKKLLCAILNQSQIDLHVGSNIGRNWIVINSVINGLIKAGDRVTCLNSKLEGVIETGDNVKITDSTLKGNISIGVGSKIIGGVRLSGEISIGKFSTIDGPNSDIECALNKVSIGNFCSIARNVSIQEFNHDFSRMSSYFVRKNLEKRSGKEDLVSKGEITISHDVWIGTQCVILSGASIGTGAVIAANSVVTGSIPPYAIAAGSPANVIKYRFDESTIAGLLASEWWNKDEAEVLRLFNEFNSKHALKRSGL